MPLYPYRCTGCGKEQEALQSLEERDAGVDAPSCCAPMELLVGNAHIGLCETTLARSAYHSRAQYDKPSDDRGALFDRLARAAGVSTTGKWYNPALARFLGDPEAWVSGMDDIKQRCIQRGWKFTIKDGDIHIEARVDTSRPMAEQTPNLVQA